MNNPPESVVAAVGSGEPNRYALNDNGVLEVDFSLRDKIKINIIKMFCESIASKNIKTSIFMENT
ncbi:MAG: hypothetical protein GJT30_01640 [Geobacter sp.]|nr:hypothetical protein [Geobacter sp.]